MANLTVSMAFDLDSNICDISKTETIQRHTKTCIQELKLAVVPQRPYLWCSEYAVWPGSLRAVSM